LVIHNDLPEGSRTDPSPRSRRQLAELCFGVVRGLRQRATERAAEFGLSFLQARALWRLEQPQPTGTLAEALGLDRSNITSVVDRIEALGLVTREGDPEDRRVKLLALTAKGRSTRAELDEALFASVTLFDALSADEQHQLAGLLVKILERVETDAVPAP
jgi:DNA-binding MarR family transcriptional regulator